jgi:hypothetical protein
MEKKKEKKNNGTIQQIAYWGARKGTGFPCPSQSLL